MGNLGYGFRPVHPGELLKDEVEYRGLTQRKLAEQMGISYTVLDEILNSRRPIMSDVAVLIEAALGINAELLMRMQTKYNMQTAREDKTLSKRAANVRKMVAASS